MRATHHFIAVFSLLRFNKKKREIQRNTLEIFLEFLVFRKEKQIKEKRKNKNEKNYLHGKAPNKQKKNKEIFLGFLLIETN